MDDIDPAKLDAALERLQAEQSRRLQAKTEAGELVTVPLCVAVSTASKAPAAVEQAQARKLAELRAAGEVREVRFDTRVVVTGVAAPGEDIGEEWKPAPRPLLPHVAQDEDKEEVREDPQPQLEFYVWTTVRLPNDDGSDPGEIREGWYSVEDGEIVLTDSKHKYITSRALGDQNPADLAKQLLREARAPEDFNRRLDYPKLGVA
jgi:hypothetical protein